MPEPIQSGAQKEEHKPGIKYCSLCRNPVSECECKPSPIAETLPAFLDNRDQTQTNSTLCSFSGRKARQWWIRPNGEAGYGGPDEISDTPAVNHIHVREVIGEEFIFTYPEHGLTREDCASLNALMERPKVKRITLEISFVGRGNGAGAPPISPPKSGQPSPGALRAAQECLNSLDSHRYSTVESLAALIDSETSLPELLQACRYVLETLRHVKHCNEFDYRAHPRKDIFSTEEMLSAAISKAERGADK